MKESWTELCRRLVEEQQAKGIEGLFGPLPRYREYVPGESEDVEPQGIPYWLEKA